ncbi:ChrR family anti-sigma-E factor [Uliginosibacterium sp. H1]|uniref:ChrR family anti-sigma-E factor n=1 Tax=Uliginosibacterium sp. H1 TaxID=3114757 RepID=UPI002E194047|nr:ChrR family anti-sigma-E factor [Uliginosibacterium sp. H1]
MSMHHPDDDLLLSLAVGSLDRASAIVIAAHLEGCTDCCQRLELLEAVGGEMLADIEPVEMEVGAFSRTLERLDPLPALPTAPAASARPRPDLPAGMHWPRSLEGCDITPWKRLGPGMRWSRITVPGDPQANAFLLRMAAGMQLAAHTHGGRELTQVLYGAFDDGRDVWRAGDLDETDGDVHHRPVVTADSECICLVALTGGRTRFDGLIARALGAWMGI